MITGSVLLLAFLLTYSATAQDAGELSTPLLLTLTRGNSSIWTGIKGNGLIPNGDGANGIVDMGPPWVRGVWIKPRVWVPPLSKVDQKEKKKASEEEEEGEDKAQL